MTDGIRYPVQYDSLTWAFPKSRVALAVLYRGMGRRRYRRWTKTYSLPVETRINALYGYRPGGGPR